MAERGWCHIVFVLILADMLAVLGALGLAESTCHALSSSRECTVMFASPSLLPLAAAILGTFWLRGAYMRRNLLGGPDEYGIVVTGVLLLAAVIATFAYLTGTSSAFPRPWFLSFWPALIFFTVLERFAVRRFAHRYRSRWFARRLLVVGASDQGLAIAGQLHQVQAGIDVVGILDDYLPLGTRLPLSEGSVLRIVGHPQEATRLVGELAIDLVVVVPAALSWESHQAMIEILDARPQFEVRFAPTAFDVTSVGFEAAPLQYVPLLRLRPRRLLTFDAFLRAVVDYPLALAALVIVAPVALTLIALARLRGVRDVIEMRKVFGEEGTVVGVPLLSPKVTRAVLMRGSPALISVLRGDLALVGPRPILLDEAPELLRWKRLLVSVKPGLTGPWRLFGPEFPMEERVFADVWWLRNWTVWRHLFVLCQTTLALLRPAMHPRRLVRWQES